VAGDTDEEVIDFVVARYGEYVLLTPQRDGINLILWGAGPAGLLLASLLAFAYLRNRAPARTEETLSDEEKARLEKILGE
jgi:cytochrome c-type biogenesis protein CcmH